MNQTESSTVSELFDLHGRSALVTGAAGYLGFAIATALAEQGATVVVGSRDRERAESTAQKLPVSADRCHHGVQLNHKDEASLRDGFSDAIDLTGGLDILFNNGQEGTRDDWTNISADGFQDHLANATGYFLLARLMRDQAVKRKMPASIIMIGSMYGVVASYPDAYQDICPASSVGYHALKGGVIHMTRHLAVYWAADGIRVNCVSPGPFPQPSADQQMVRRLCQKSPLGRMGLPHELKGVAVLLASNAGSYITGQNIIVDGGWTAW